MADDVSPEPETPQHPPAQAQPPAPAAQAQAQPPREQPREQRPQQPQYGELAPEGWSWNPPDQPRHDAPTTEARHPRGEASNAPTVAEAHERRPAPGWNKAVTLLLLIVGILGMFMNIAIVSSAPSSLALMYSNEGLGDYEMAASVPGLITAASIAQVLVFIATAVASFGLLAAKRRSFYVPLVGGVLAAVINLAFMTAIVATDTTLIEYYGTL